MEYDKQHQQILESSVRLIKEKLHDIIAIIIFGSFGTKYERSDSDLDIAVLTTENPPPIKPDELWYLAQNVAVKIGRDVDIVDLREASTVFNYQIITSGTAIYCSNDLKLAEYENLMMSMYLRLQEERKDIIEDFGKGSFYG